MLPLVTGRVGVTVIEGGGSDAVLEKKSAQTASGREQGANTQAELSPDPSPASLGVLLQRRVMNSVCVNIKLINEICVLKQ